MPRPSIILGAAGLALVVAGAWLLVGNQDSPVGDTPPPAAVAPPAATSAAEAEPEPEPELEPEPDPAPTPTPEPAAAPVALAVPAIDVDAAAVPVGLEPDGSMEIPEDVTTVGWYDLGVAPGEDGSAVLAGHVDSRTQGLGAFGRLREIDVDDEVTVTHEDGATSAWVVTGRSSYPKDQAPLAELFRRGGDPQLVLITCGGDFDRDQRSYADNVVVLLAPA